MINIIDGVRSVLEKDDISRNALARDVLNMSAYAKRIKRDVEKFTKKPVKEATIVTALARLGIKLREQAAQIPDVEIEDISMRSGITELSYERRSDVIKLLSTIHDKKQHSPNFMTTTIGAHEVTILASSELVENIKNVLTPAKPKFERKNLVAITVHSKPNIIDIPNITYALLRRVAVHNINLVEIVSTYTEITFIVSQKDASKVIELIS